MAGPILREIYTVNESAAPRLHGMGMAAAGWMTDGRVARRRLNTVYTSVTGPVTLYIACCFVVCAVLMRAERGI